MKANNNTTEKYAWLAFGLALGALITVNFAIALDNAKSWYEKFKDFQTLMSGIIALIAAGISYHIVRAQINSSEQLAEERLRRRAFAIRANLPLHSSILMDYVSGCFEVLKKIYKDGSATGCYSNKKFELIILPEKSMDYFVELIETHNAKNQNNLASFLRRLQICHARFCSIGEQKNHIKAQIIKVITKYELIGMIYEYLELYVMVDELFIFGRNESENYEPAFTLERINNAVRVSGVDSHEINQYINGR